MPARQKSHDRGERTGDHEERQVLTHAANCTYDKSAGVGCAPAAEGRVHITPDCPISVDV